MVPEVEDLRTSPALSRRHQHCVLRDYTLGGLLVVSSPPRARTRLVATAAVAALTCLGAATTAAADETSEDGLGLSVEVIDHGHIATETNASISETGMLPDGTPVLYISGSGEPATFTVVNAETGELISSEDLPPKSIGSQVQPMADGSAYFGMRDGKGIIIYHWDPQTRQSEEVLENPVGGRLIREFQVGDDGMLYGATYPNTKVFSYDPDTGEVRDYGSVLDENDGDTYAEGFSVVGDTAYVGTGMQNGHAVSVDLDSGETTEMQLPEGYQDISRFYRFQQVGDLVAMGFSPGISGGTNTLFWDTANDEWACDGAIDSFVSLNNPYTEPTQDGRFYYKANDEIWEFDSTDCSTSPTGWIDTGLADTGDHRALNLLTLGTGEETEYRLLGLNRDSSFWTFDPATGDQQVFEGTVEGSPLTSHSIHVGPDGRVYMGIYLSPLVLGRYDPATGEHEQLSGPSQADSWLTYDDQLLIGTYGNAVIHEGDPFADWDWGTNPSEQFRLISEDQDRPVAMATDDELVAIATVADYGMQGGGLTITDMADRRDTYRDLVEHQSTASVTFGEDGLVYAGTSIRGGLSSENSPLDAHLVVVDPQDGHVLDTVVPVPGNDVVADVAAVGDSIWGVTNSADVFEYDTTTGEVNGTYPLETPASTSPWGRASTLEAHPNDGLLYGISGGAIFAFDPQTHESQILADDVDYKRMDIAADGTIYALSETEYYEIHVSGETPECTQTIDSRHAGPLHVSEGTTCLTGAGQFGPVTVDKGAGLIVEEANVVGPVHAAGAATVQLLSSTITGPVQITGTNGTTVISDNRITGPLSCSGNTPSPTDLGAANRVAGPQSGQCADL